MADEIDEAVAELEAAQQSKGANLNKFLEAIRKAEGADYNTLYGGGKFQDFSDHPRQKFKFKETTGAEKTTSAAGGYQFLESTWDRLQKKLKLKDFSPESQDIAAMELIREAGAMEDVESGNFDAAMQKVGGIWASLPTSPHAQPRRSKEFMASALNQPPDFSNKNPEVKGDLLDELGIPLEEVNKVQSQDLVAELGITPEELQRPISLRERLDAGVENVAALLGVGREPAIRGEVLQSLPGRVIPGTVRGGSRGMAMLNLQEAAELSNTRKLIARMGTEAPPTPAELGTIQSTKGKMYIAEAINAQGDQAKMNAVLTRLDDEVLSARQDSERHITRANEEEAKLRAMDPENPSFLEQAAISVGESIGPTLGAAAISAVNPAAAIAAGAAGMSFIAAGESYHEAGEIAKRRGIELTPEKQMRFAALDALFEGVGEATSLKVALKAGLPIFDRIAHAIVGESSSEAATAVMQKANEFLQLNPDMTLKEFGYEVALSATAGAMGGAAMGATAGGAQHIAGRVSDEAALRSAVEEMERSDNPFLPTPEEEARRVLQPTGAGEPVGTPKQQFISALKQDADRAAQLSDRLLESEGPEGVLPGVLAVQLMRSGEITQEQYLAYRKALSRKVSNVIVEGEREELQKIDEAAAPIEKRIKDFGEAPTDYTPTEEEAGDLDFAEQMFQRTRGMDPLEATGLVAAEMTKQGRNSIVMQAWKQMMLEAKISPYEAVELRQVAPNDPVGYLKVLAQRQANGYYPFANNFYANKNRPEEGFDQPWYDPQGKEINLQEVHHYGAVHGFKNKEVGQRLAGTLTAWMKSLAPNARIMLVDRQGALKYNPLMHPATAGFMHDTSADSAIIFVDETKDEGELVEILAHEFGHFLTQHYFSKMPASIQDAVKKAYATEMRKLTKMSASAAVEKQRGPFGIQSTPGTQYGNMPVEKLLPSNPFLRGYLYSGMEWTAHQMERLVTSGKLDLDQKAASFFKRLLGILKRMFERYKQDFAPNQTFEDFIVAGALRERQRHIRDMGLAQAEQMLKDYGMDLEEGEAFEVDDYLRKAFAKVGVPTALQEEVEASPELKQKAASAMKRVGLLEVAMFTPGEDVPLSGEEWVASIEDSWLPGQSTNSIRDALSVANPQTPNQGMPRSKSASRIASALKNYWKYSARRSKYNPDTSQYEGHLDRYGWMRKFLFSLEQWAKINPHIETLQRYLQGVREWSRDRMAWIARADGRLKEWRKLTKQEQLVLGRFMLDQTLAGKFFDLSDPAMQQKYPLTLRAREMYSKVKEDFDDFITAVEATLVAQASKRLVRNPFAAAREIQRIKERFGELKQRPYFPLSRFGKYIVSVKATKIIKVKGNLYNPGDVMHLEAFDTRAAQLAEFERIKRAYPSGDAKMDEVSEDTASLMGMPTLLLEALKNNPDVGLTNDQKKALDEYMYKIAPGQSFVKHLMERKGVEGYTEDVQRSYANYFFHGASHLARIKHAEALNDEIRATHLAADLITGDSTKRRAIANYMARHFKYIMVPENDWAGVRANVAVAYLAGVLKTALVNLTQVPMVTYPHLAAKFGDSKALRALQKAYGDSLAMYHVTKTLSKAEEEALTRWSQGQPLRPGDERIVRQWSKFDAEERNGLRQAVQEGFIDESFAMELAAMSEGSWLTRFKATSQAGYYWRNLQFYSMVPFQAAEKLNRRVTFIAAFRLAKQSGAAYDQAYEAAREAVSATQYEYAKWNRAELLRGKKGVFFMFFQYMLNTLFFAFGGDKGWWRWWLIMLAAAGPMGLPFADSLKDLATWIGQKLKGPDSRFDADLELKKAAGDLGEAIGVTPDLLLHGISRYGFGILPFADLSGSLSMGRIPIISTATSLLADPQRDFDAALRKGVSEVGGASASLAMRMLQAASTDDVDLLRRIEKGMPLSFAKHLLEMGRWYRDGAVETQSGAKIEQFDSNDPWHLAELAAKGLGFQPRRVSQETEQRFLEQDHIRFYQLRRTILLGKLDFEFEKGDRESIGEVIEAIRRYNHSVPSGSLAITTQQIRQSRMNKEKGRALEEQAVARQPMYRDLVQQLRDATRSNPQ